jgi:hypothetical protein
MVIIIRKNDRLLFTHHYALIPEAFGAGAEEFDEMAFNFETCLLTKGAEGMAEMAGIQVLYCPTGIANQMVVMSP